MDVQKVEILFTIVINFLVCHSIALNRENLIGGSKTDLGSFSSIVSIQNEIGHVCGGTIIEEEFILTAAHCVTDKVGIIENYPLWIVAGTNNLKNTMTRDQGIKIPIETVFVSKGYNPRSSYEDIAVLRLKYPLDLRYPLTQKINLSFNLDKKYEGARATVVGFGWDSISYKVMANGNLENLKGKTTGKLRSGVVEILSKKECQKNYSVKFWHFFNIKIEKIYDSYVCARMLSPSATYEAGVCQGDSGSPLISENNEQIAVLSGGSKACDDTNLPGIYIRVAAYRDFINDVLMRNPSKQYYSADLPDSPVVEY